MVKSAVKQIFGLRVNKKRKKMKGHLEFMFFINKVKRNLDSFQKTGVHRFWAPGCLGH